MREASDGQEALEVWNEWKPDLILMDVRMPIMDGKEATRKIRATSNGNEVMIIALTANAFDKDGNEALESGMNDYLCKPFKIEELLAKIKCQMPVEYIYAEGQFSSNQEKSNVPLLLSTDKLMCLPTELLNELEQATLNGDIEQLKTLIKSIAEKDPRLSDALLVLADQYEYDRLLKLLEEIRTPLTY